MIDEPTWGYLEGYFGEDVCAVVDRAAQSQFDRYPTGVKREDFYLITEGIAYAVLKSLHDQGLRVVR